MILILIIVCTIFTVLFLLWVFSNAPSLWRRDNKTQLDYIEEKALQDFHPYLTDKPIIVRSWKEAPGLMKMIKIPKVKWLDLDCNARKEILLIQTDKKSAFTFLVHPKFYHEAYQAGQELLENIIGFINNKFPDSIVVEKHSLSTDIIGVKIQNSALSKYYYPVSTNIHACSQLTTINQTTVDQKYHPLQVCRHLVGDDLNLLLKVDPSRSPTGHAVHLLIASALCFPDRWHLEEKIGLPLAAIHYPVHTLNRYQESMSSHSFPSQNPIIRAMERFFDQLQCNDKNSDDLTIRLGFGFQAHPIITNRYNNDYVHLRVFLRSWAEYFFGSHLEMQLRSTIRITFTTIFNYLRIEWLGLPRLHPYLRTERQAFRYLPNSQTIVFSIRTRVNSLMEVITTSEEAQELYSHVLQISEVDNSSKGEFKQEILSWLRNRW